ncbi:MAG: ATP-binding protein [Anaerolineales bacterium]
MEIPENNSFAEKLERLFEEKTKPDGTPYTPADILDATQGILTRVHLWKLRTGNATNPSFKVIQSLADAFGVHPGYFFENPDRKQLQTGTTQFKQQAFNLPTLLNKTLDLMEARLTKKQLLFELKTARNVPAEITGDPEQLRRVLVNLLDNAIKFTTRGGIWVKVSLPEKEALCIEVTDTGPGIPPDQLPDIFEPSRRGSDYVQREHQGAGLGLSIAKQLVTGMGGQISVASTLGVGSTFTICLPLDGVPT